MDLDLEVETETPLAAEDLPNFRLHSSEFDEATDTTEGEHESAESTPQLAVHEGIKDFLSYFYLQFKERNVKELHPTYENFHKLTEKYYKSTSWPSADAISGLVNNDKVFLIFYKELYFRHIYSNLTPSLQHRIESYQNYIELFDFLINSEAGIKLELDLPSTWLWLIIDEFIYQFQSFAQYIKSKGKTDEELATIKSHPQVWSSISVLKYLHALVNKSHILQYLEREKKGQETVTDDISAHPVYRYLGYYSIIGLVRVHVLFGDYWLALKTLEPIDFSKLGLYSKVLLAQVSLNHYRGVAYLMTHRYVDAIKTFTNALLTIARTKQYHTRSSLYEILLRKNDILYLLLSLAIAVCPQKIDDSINTALKEKYSDKMSRIQKGESIDVSEIAFAFPKSVSPAVNPAEATVNNHQQIKIFLSGIEQQVKESQIPSIRSFLKLYSTIPTAKLANFLEVDENTIRTYLLSFKNKTHSLVSTNTTALSGKYVPVLDVDFYIDLDMIHIGDTKVTPRFGDYLINNINKLSEIIRNLEVSANEHPTRKN